jgi:chemotaxis protein CheD
MVYDRRKDGECIRGLLVKPGEIIVTSEGLPLISIAARGVVVCLWEKVAHYAGMCSFVLPRTTDPSKATGQYGNIALLKLISMIRNFDGCTTLEAQIFGGAHKNENDTTGEENVKIARTILTAKEIPIISEDIGGLVGRKILFDGETGQAAVLKVHRLRKEDWGE